MFLQHSVSKSSKDSQKLDNRVKAKVLSRLTLFATFFLDQLLILSNASYLGISLDGAILTKNPSHSIEKGK